MSAGEISAEKVLTSTSESMDTSEIDIKETTKEIEIVYSHIKSDTVKSEQIGSVNSVESSSKINSENDVTTDRLSATAEINSLEHDTVDENHEKPPTDDKIEVDSLEGPKTKGIPLQTCANGAENTTNLSESTFGLITQDPRIEKFIPPVENLKNIQVKVQSDVISPENAAMQLDEQTSKTCLIDSEKNLLTGQKKDCATGEAEINKTVNSLSFLATEYASSDSDEDEMPPSPCEIITIVDDSDYKTQNKPQNKTQYRSKPINDDSTSEDTDSDSDSSENSDTSDSDSDSDSDSEIEDGPENVSKTQPSKMKKTKSEFEDLPPIEELKITVPEELCDRLGEVSGIVEQLVIVRPISGKPTLNLDSILFLEKGHRVLGQVFDVFGQVADPHYCVRFNSEEHIKKTGITVGMEVYYSPNTEHTSLVFLHELVKLKGIDVSGEDDVEPPEFSDDEEERAYNQLQRQKQRQKPGNEGPENSETEGLSQKRWCPERQRNPWSSDWQSRNYNNSRGNRSFGQAPPRWNPENSQPPFQNQFNSQNPVHPTNQPPPNQYGQPNTFDTYQYQYNPYNNPYQQNFPPPNQRYAFGRPPGFPRPDFNSYGQNLYQPNPYPPPPMSWAPPPPPPPPPSSM